MISRRAMILAATGMGLSCLAPDVAFAQGDLEEEGLAVGEMSVEPYMRTPLSPEETELLLQAKAEREAEAIIAEAEAAFEAEHPSATASSRPTYSTVYGSVKVAHTGFKEVAGQGQWGTQAQKGTNVHVYAAFSGGGTMSVTVSFATPFGSMGVSLPLPKMCTAATAGVSMQVPDDGHWYKMLLDVYYEIKPYVVYVTKNGKKSVYRRNYVRNFNGRSIGQKRTK